MHFIPFPGNSLLVEPSGDWRSAPLQAAQTPVSKNNSTVQLAFPQCIVYAQSPLKQANAWLLNPLQVISRMGGGGQTGWGGWGVGAQLQVKKTKKECCEFFKKNNILLIVAKAVSRVALCELSDPTWPLIKDAYKNCIMQQCPWELKCHAHRRLLGV